MKAIVALIVALLAFPVVAEQDHTVWLECVATYLSKQNIVTGKPQGMIALDAMVACEHVSLRTPGEDLDVLNEIIAHFRRVHAMPPGVPLPRSDLRF